MQLSTLGGATGRESKGSNDGRFVYSRHNRLIRGNGSSLMLAIRGDFEDAKAHLIRYKQQPLCGSWSLATAARSTLDETVACS